MSAQIEAELANHRQEIDGMKDTLNRTLTSLDKNTEAMSALTTQFAVYASKHDTVEQELSSIRTKQDLHSEHIAAMRPVVDGVRGLVWKVVAGSLIGGSGVAAVIVAIFGK